MTVISRWVKILLVVVILISTSNCSFTKSQDRLELTKPSPTATPTASSEIPAIPITVPSTAPQDLALDTACRQTIEAFHTMPCDDWEAVRGLFIPSQQRTITPDSWACTVVSSRTLLTLIPASEWWSLHSDEPLPRAASPTAPNEYVYFVEFELHWAPGAISTGENPFSHLVWLVSDANGDCKIKEYGW